MHDYSWPYITLFDHIIIVYFRSEALQLDITSSWYSIWNFTLLIMTNRYTMQGFFFFFFSLFLFFPLYFITYSQDDFDPKAKGKNHPIWPMVRSVQYRFFTFRTPGGNRVKVLLLVHPSQFFLALQTCILCTC